MILAPEQYDILFNHASRRVGYKQAVRMWPNATVPFVLDNNFSKAGFKKLSSQIDHDFLTIFIFQPLRRRVWSEQLKVLFRKPVVYNSIDSMSLMIELTLFTSNLAMDVHQLLVFPLIDS